MRRRRMVEGKIERVEKEMYRKVKRVIVTVCGLWLIQTLSGTDPGTQKKNLESQEKGSNSCLPQLASTISDSFP